MQIGLDLGHEIVVDLFAGGGGASLGIEQALGRPVDVAVNHDPEAIAMHRANHPGSYHYCENVFRVSPVDVTRHRPVGLLWASPDCTHHSKAKGGKPVCAKRRGLAWVVVRWARRIRPRVIMLENVEEFAAWGPLTEDGRPCPARKGQIFRQWIHQIERLGYRVEHRTLRACDYGAPTIRRRLFLIARRDGLPIRWPDPSHGAPDSPQVLAGRLAPWRTAAECIDWSLPCPSIFGRQKPLADNTLRRIARGIRRFVLDAAEPFIIPLTHHSDSRCHPVGAPLRTITSAHRGEQALVAPYFVQRYGERDGQHPRCRPATEPLQTIVPTGNGAQLVAAFLAKHYGGHESPGCGIDQPTGTVTARDHHALVAAHVLNLKGTDRRMRAMDTPAPTVCAGGTHAAMVAALMAPYYGQGSGQTGRDMRDPVPTVTSRDRLQLITATIDDAEYIITDIGMRMLTPRELFRAQGFPDDYIIDPQIGGRPLTKTAQVRMCGNSVPPVWPRALVGANFAHEAAWRTSG